MVIKFTKKYNIVFLKYKLFLLYNTFWNYLLNRLSYAIILAALIFKDGYKRKIKKFVKYLDTVGKPFGLYAKNDLKHL